jgi:hypothetical protein
VQLCASIEGRAGRPVVDTAIAAPFARNTVPSGIACAGTANLEPKNERRAAVKDSFRRGALTIAWAVFAVFASGLATAERSAPSDAALARAELLMTEMLAHVQALRAADGAERRRALWAELRLELAGLDALERGDRLCPICPMLLQYLASGTDAGPVEGVIQPQEASGDRRFFGAAFPQVPVSVCGSAAARDDATHHCVKQRGLRSMLGVF